MSKVKIRLFAVALVLLYILQCFAVSCEKNTDTAEEVSFFAMDTYMTLKVYRGGRSKKEAQDALNAAKQEILRIEALLSVTEPDSEISALNRGEVLQNASSDIVGLLKMAKELHEMSEGAYDVTAYPLLLAWGFTTDKGLSVPTAEEIEAALTRIDISAVSISDNGNGGYSVSVGGGVMLDLGSIAKGYAGQRAADVVSELGFDSLIFVLGGNVQTLGRKPDGSGFRVGVADPNAPDNAALILPLDKIETLVGSDKVADKGLAVVTSGAYQRNFTEDGKVYHHIMDVTTGYPCDNGLASVTVICPDGALADGLSTTLFLLGYEGAMEYYSAHGGFEAVFITADGERFMTAGLTSVLNEA